MVVESTLASSAERRFSPLPDEEPAQELPYDSRALVPAPALAPELSPVTIADIHLIPRTLPPTRTSKQQRRPRSSRMNIIKFSLIVAVTLTVLSATLATAGGGQVFRYLSNALGNIGPYTPATPKPAFITQRVKPLTQWNPDAGYDSQAQRDAYWNSACSAAVLTELLTAWGVPNITIGRMIDELGPDITPWGGLMTQSAWNRIAQMHNMHATVYLNRQLSYNDIVHMTVAQGIPVILDLRDSQGLYYPALYGGHFLIVVGGSSIGLTVVDSSLYHITFISTDQLDYLWQRGESIVMLPN
ncbi:MAG TPA: hypothetical protein VH540_24030 [Ktedonobacterales bacterium]|jgi:hypothetical protein